MTILGEMIKQEEDLTAAFERHSSKLAAFKRLSSEVLEFVASIDEVDRGRGTYGPNGGGELLG
jgi:hypothetical protein